MDERLFKVKDINLSIQPVCECTDLLRDRMILTYWKAWKSSRARLSLKKEKENNDIPVRVWHTESVGNRSAKADTVLTMATSEIDFDISSDTEDSGEYIQYERV